MPRKNKIGTEIAHVTRDSDTTFKIKRSKGKVTRPLYSGGCSGQPGIVLGVGKYCYVASARRRGRRWDAHGGRRGAGTYCVATRTGCFYYNYYTREQRRWWRVSTVMRLVTVMLDAKTVTIEITFAQTSD